MKRPGACWAGRPARTRHPSSPPPKAWCGLGFSGIAQESRIALPGFGIERAAKGPVLTADLSEGNFMRQIAFQ